MDDIKEAFKRVKQDITNLNNEVYFLKQKMDKMKQYLVEISYLVKNLNEKSTINRSQARKTLPTDNPYNSTYPTKSPADEPGFKGLKAPIWPISTGNEGVPADRQTNQQTNQQTQNTPKMLENPIDNAATILNSLDNIKKEIRLKFKKLTEQEVLVFSAIYQLEEQQELIDYSLISKKLGLTESSIRDYVGKLIKKGIPVEKKKINNKKICLSISENLKRIASLSTILELRNL